MSQIRVELQLEDKSFVQGVWRAGQSLKEFKSELARTHPHFARLQQAGQANILSFRRQEEQTRSLTRSLRDVAIIAGGATLAFRALTGASNGIIGSMVRVNAEMERLRYQLAGMSNAVDPMREATEQVRQLQALAAKTPFSFDELTRSFVKFTAAGLNPTMREMTALSDAIAAFGASDVQLHRVSIAIQQMQGKGVLSMEELRQQLGENMPSALTMFARSMNLTVGEMVRLISMGVVESTSALQGFFGEIERSYAGTGRFMMQTFSGQMSRIRTELTRLITGERGQGEMGNAFDMFKQKMSEFADFLAGQDAAAFFDTVGRGLQSLMTLVEFLTGAVMNLRDFFAEWGMLIVAGVAGAAVLRAIGALVSRMMQIGVAYQGVAAAARNAAREVRAFSVTQATAAATGPYRNAQGQFISRAQALAQAQSAQAAAAAAAGAAQSASLMRTTTAMGGLIAAGSRFLAVLGPIGIGLAVLGPIAWEIGKGIRSWATSADEANQALERTVEGQTRVMRAQRAADAARIQSEIEHFEQLEAQRQFDLPGARRIYDDEIARRQEMLARHSAETERMVGEFLLQNVEQQARKAEERITLATREISRAYHQSMVDMDAEYRDALETAEERGVSARMVQEEFRQRRNDARIRRQLAVIAAFNEEIERLSSLNSGEVTVEAISALIEQRERLRAEMADWSPDDFRVRLLTGQEDEEKKTERLVRSVERARERFVDLQAEMNGASGALARLVYQIERGDFGNFSTATDEIVALRDMLLETTIAAELLDGVMKGINSAESDAARIVQNQRRNILRLEAIIEGVDVQNEAEFFTWMRDTGRLDGMQEPQQIIDQTLANITRGVDLTRTGLVDLGTTIRDDAFGQGSVLRINEVETALGSVRDIASEIREALSGNMGLGTFTPMPGFLEAIGQGGATGWDSLIRTESGGRWGARNNVPGAGGIGHFGRLQFSRARLAEAQRAGAMPMGMTPEEFLARPDVQEAVERWHFAQIDDFIRRNGLDRFLGSEIAGVPVTQQGMRAVAHLGGNESLRRFLTTGGLYNPSDAYGTSLLNYLRTHQGAVAQPQPEVTVRIDPSLREEVTEAITAGQGRVNAVIDGEMADNNRRERELTPQAALAELARELTSVVTAQTAGSQDERMGTRERQVRERIASGEFSSLDSAAVQAVLDLAIQADANLAAVQERARDLGRLDTNAQRLEDERRDIERRRLEALARAQDPNYRGQSSELRRLIDLEREQLAIAERLYGLNSPEYQAEANRLAQQRAALMRAEASEALVELAQAARSSERSVIADQRALRQREFDERIAELTALRDRAIADGALVAEANILFERAVAAERERLRNENKTALQQQLDEMANYAERINRSTADWAKQLGNVIYESFSDPDAFKNLGRSIRESIARSLADAAAASILRPFETLIAGNGTPGTGIGGIIERAINALTGNLTQTINTAANTMMNSMGGMSGLVTKGKGGAAVGAKGKGIPVGVKHTGGIVGQRGGSMRMTSAANFIGAPKFHTGGIVGKGHFRSGLTPSEVPIIAKKGEGVFTPEQMKHLGGTINNRTISINAPVTVNASGGTPEQNSDLARKVADETERMMRNIVQQEMVRQMRPGGMLR